jgi:plasmid stability protein
MSKMIQLRNVPDELHRKLKVRAAQQGQSLSDYLITQVRELVNRPSPAEMRERLASRSAAIVKESAADAVRAERSSR